MRLLHTADWHLGNSLFNHDRTDELFNQVERVCQIAEQNHVEVLLVAGDVFEGRSRLPEITKRLANALSPYVRRGMHVILIPGNHDDREHFRMMHALLAIEQGQIERVHIVQTRMLISIAGVQFGVIPYPISELLAPHNSNDIGAAQRHQNLSSAYADLVRAVVNEFDPTMPAVFVSHINVAGVKTSSERESTYFEDIRLGTRDLPDAPNLAYIALGHIHQRQRIDHVVPCYYSGSIERMNFGEREDGKFVLLVDIPPNGPASVTEVPLVPTPFYEIHLLSSELNTLNNRFSDLERAYFKIYLECEPGHDPVVLQRQIRKSFPRCIDLQLSRENLPSLTADLPERPKDYTTTALDYLRQAYIKEPDFIELEKRAKDLICEVSDADTTN
jgi:exonuclease SbcD